MTIVAIGLRMSRPLFVCVCVDASQCDVLFSHKKYIYILCWHSLEYHQRPLRTA